MVKDTLFVLTPILFQNAFLQVLYVSAVLLPYVLLVVRYQPYKMLMGMQLDASIHGMILFLTLLSGIAFDENSADTSAAAGMFVAVFCSALGILFMCLVWCILRILASKCKCVATPLESSDQRRWLRVQHHYGQWALTNESGNQKSLLDLWAAYQVHGLEKIVQEVEPVELEDLLRALRAVGAVARVGGPTAYGSSAKLILPLRPAVIVSAVGSVDGIGGVLASAGVSPDDKIAHSGDGPHKARDDNLKSPVYALVTEHERATAISI